MTEEPSAKDIVDYLASKIWWLTVRYQNEVQIQLYLGKGPDIGELKRLHSNILQKINAYQLIIRAIDSATTKETVEEMDKTS